MDIITLGVLFILGIVLYRDFPMFSSVFFLLVGLFSYSGITLNTIASLSGQSTITVTYLTVDPWISYAISFIFIAMALINFLDQIDIAYKERKKKQESFT